MQAPVSVWILVARTDVNYMLKTIPHQIRSCNYPFVERVLAVDTSPLSGDKIYRYNIGSQEQLDLACQTLVEQGVIDRVVKIDYDSQEIKKVYQKYFGVKQAQQMLNHTHNWKGSTIYPSLYCIEKSTTDYYLHFDADMLLHQDQDYNWIAEAIEVMASTPTIAAIRPFCGPPDSEGTNLNYKSCLEDKRGFYAQKFFSMRVYLIDRKRFSQLAPFPLMWKFPPLLSRKLPASLQSLFAKLERRMRPQSGPIQGALESFEPMTSKKLQSTNFVRADLSSPKAWTLHPPKHGSDFIEALPKLIESIEQNKYPQAQAGHYDLLLEKWSELLAST